MRKYVQMEVYMKRKKFLTYILIGSFIIAVPFTKEKLDMFASTSNRDQAQNELDDLQNQVGDLENRFEDLESQMSAKAQELSDLMADQRIIRDNIQETREAIAQTEKDLEVAKKKEQEEYEAMKLRIKYMYENSTQDSVVDAILNSNGVVDMLNRVEYVSQVYKSDRELMEQYKAAVVEVETIAAELEMELNDLLTLEEQYEHQEAQVEEALAALKSEAADYETQIANAKTRAEELADYIAEQNRLIEKKRQEQLLLQQQEEQRRKEEQKRQE